MDGGPPDATPAFGPGALALVFAAVGVGVVAMGLSDAALAWDGAYYLFRMLDDGGPFVVFGRYGVLPIQAPAWIAIAAGAGMEGVRAAFSFGHAAVPAIALALCWWMVRREAPALFLWAVVGIGLITLPGQLFLVSEAIQTAQLAWPIFLWLIVGAPRRGAFIAACLVLLLVVLHPASSIVLGGGGSIGLLLGWRRGAPRTSRAAWILIGVALIRALILLGGWWESKGIEHAGYALHFKQAVRGLPLVGLLLGYGGAALALRRRQRGARFAPVLACLGVAVLLVWAARPAAWGEALGYRSWGPPFTVFAFALAALDVAPGQGAVDHVLRRRLAGIFAAGFAAVLAIQGFHWARLTDRVEAALGPRGCHTVDDLPGARETALGHWGIGAHSLLLQGERPRTVIFHEAARCAPARLERGLQLTSTYLRPRDAAGRFDLRGTGLPAPPTGSAGWAGGP